MNIERPGHGASPTRGGGWRIRFDAPPLDGPTGRADHADLLALFRAWDGADRACAERRRSPRYTPTVTRIWVGWWRLGHFRVVRGVLVNLSMGGALVHLAQQPPSAVPVWICLGTPYPVDYAQARVLETTPIAGSPPEPKSGPGPEPSSSPPGASADSSDQAVPEGPWFATRLQFHDPCPPTFFAAAGRRPDPMTDSRDPRPTTEPEA